MKTLNSMAPQQQAVTVGYCVHRVAWDTEHLHKLNKQVQYLYLADRKNKYKVRLAIYGF